MSGRYLRHELLEDVGQEGQKKIRSARVAIVGLGGLGCPTSLYLASSGIGRLTLIDGDCVTEDNLARQILYTIDAVERPKADVAREFLSERYPDCKVSSVARHLGEENASDLLRDHDIVVDATDRYDVRYLTQRVAREHGAAWTTAAVDRTYGLLCSIPHSADAPCYGCVFGAPPPPSLQTSCRDFGILAPVVGTLGTWLAHQVLSLVLGATKTRLAEFNFQTTQVRPLEFSKDPSCPECSETTVRASRGLRAPEVGVLIDVRDPEEFAQSSLPKAQSLPLPTILNSTVDDARIQELRAKAARGIPIYVHCQSGYRAHLAQVHLLKLGISALNLHEPRSRETESCALR